MSLLLVRSCMKFRYSHQLNALWKSTARRLSVYQCNQQKSKRDTATNSSIVTSNRNERTDVSTDVRPMEKIKENTKTASYFGVIMFGVAVTGVMFFAVLRELLSSNSPNNVYSEALKMCTNDTRVQDALGTPIKGYGEETRRRRRQHVAHSIYERNGNQFIRMQFYIQGVRNKATVQLEKQLNSDRYRYLFVQLDYYPRETIILEDNRLLIDGSAPPKDFDSMN